MMESEIESGKQEEAGFYRDIWILARIFVLKPNIWKPFKDF